jgi:threonine/homoserine/homoserine lactone efflux protein
MWHVYLYGFAFGFGAAIFPGPINLEVIRRAIARGPLAAIVFGMGAVSADVFYVMAISAGAAALLAALPVWAQASLYALGAVLLLIIGVTALRAKKVTVVPDDADAELPENGSTAAPGPVRSLLRAYLLGLALTIGSPPTIFYWLLISVTAAQHFGNGVLFSLALGAGVFTACTGWVFVVSLLIGQFHHHLNPRYILFIERTVGAILICLAIYSAWQAAALTNDHVPQTPKVLQNHLMPPGLRTNGVTTASIHLWGERVTTPSEKTGMTSRPLTH